MRLPHEDYHLRHLAKLAVVTTPPFIAALALLLLNDLLLKGHYGNWVTGKLSDVAGLMVVTLLAAPFVADRPKRLFVALALAFGYWKSPWSQPLIDLVNEHSPILVTRVVDYTDLLALAVVPAALWLFRSSAVMRIEPSLLRRLAMAPVLALVVVAITGTSAPTGYTRSVVAERSPIAAEPPSAASIAKGALEQRGYACTGVLCTDDDNSVRFCENEEHLVLIVTGPTNGGFLGPPTGRFKRKQVDALVTELRSALEPRFAVTTDDQDYRSPGRPIEIGDRARALCEATENDARRAGGGA